MLIDTHCHINFNAYQSDAGEVIGRALKNDIWLINIGAQYSTSKRTVLIADRYAEGVYAVVGLHPIHLIDDITESVVIDGVKHEIKTAREEFDYLKYKALAQSSKKVVGLGEVGLDYFYFDKSDTELAAKKTLQQEVFKKFVTLATELDLPLVIHCRGHKEDPYEAYDDILTILKNSHQKARGVVHCFGGNLHQAQAFIDLGFYIGFTGIITFKNKAEELQNIAKIIPLAKILIETDAPFLAPVPYRGQRNEPAYVKLVALKIAELRELSLLEVSQATTANAKKLFNI